MANKVGKGRKRPSARRLKFDAEILAGKSNAEAARIAGYSPSVASNKAHKMAEPIRSSMAEAYRRAGLTEERSARKLGELIDARTPRWNSAKKRWDYFGDADVQMRAAQELNRVLDGYPAPKEKVEDARPITIVFPSDMKSLMPAGAEKAGG